MSEEQDGDQEISDKKKSVKQVRSTGDCVFY